MSHPSYKAGGFSLIELVIAIVLAAIVASFVVLFLDAPVQSYFAQTRRSDLVDSANRISNAITADVRTALPNSLRVRVIGSTKALELLATEGVARYYGSGDNAGEELDMGVSTASFATLDLFDASGPPYGYLSVGNLGLPPTVPNTYDAYRVGNKVMTGAGVGITVGPNPGAAGEELVGLTPAMTFQAPGTPDVHNVYLVSGPVSYVCNPTAGTLVRYSGYAVTPGQAVPPAGTSALIAHNVANCSISVVSAPGGYPPPAGGYAYGELAILTVTLSMGGESLRIFLETPTEYSQ